MYIAASRSNFGFFDVSSGMTGSGEIPNSKTQASHKLQTPISSRKQRATADRIGIRRIPRETVITGLIGTWNLELFGSLALAA
jgi:hypothetical protein